MEFPLGSRVLSRRDMLKVMLKPIPSFILHVSELQFPLSMTGRLWQVTSIGLLPC